MENYNRPPWSPWLKAPRTNWRNTRTHVNRTHSLTPLTSTQLQTRCPKRSTQAFSKSFYSLVIKNKIWLKQTSTKPHRRRATTTRRRTERPANQPTNRTATNPPTKQFNGTLTYAVPMGIFCSSILADTPEAAVSIDACLKVSSAPTRAAPAFVNISCTRDTFPACLADARAAHRLTWLAVCFSAIALFSTFETEAETWTLWNWQNEPDRISVYDVPTQNKESKPEGAFAYNPLCAYSIVFGVGVVVVVGGGGGGYIHGYIGNYLFWLCASFCYPFMEVCFSF